MDNNIMYRTVSSSHHNRAERKRTSSKFAHFYRAV
jgi:hypothetical protein